PFQKKNAKNLSPRLETRRYSYLSALDRGSPSGGVLMVEGGAAPAGPAYASRIAGRVPQVRPPAIRPAATQAGLKGGETAPSLPGSRKAEGEERSGRGRSPEGVLPARRSG